MQIKIRYESAKITVIEQINQQDSLYRIFVAFIKIRRDQPVILNNKIFWYSAWGNWLAICFQLINFKKAS